MTKPQDYTVEQFIQEIVGIIEANPDTTNATENASSGFCVYENAEGKYCIIGKWLKNIGLIDKLDGFDKAGNRRSMAEPPIYGSSALGILLELEFDYQVAKVAKSIQQVADRNIRWGDLLSAPELADIFSS